MNPEELRNILSSIQNSFNLKYDPEFEKFKFIADFTLTSNLEVKHINNLLREAQTCLLQSKTMNQNAISDYLNRMMLLVDHNLNNQVLMR